MHGVVETIKAMISAIPDGNANMRGRVRFTIKDDELMELVPWLNKWNATESGKFNGRWIVRPGDNGDDFYINFLATGM